MSRAPMLHDPASSTELESGHPVETAHSRFPALHRDVPPVVWTIGGGIAGVLTGLWITRHAWGPHAIGGGDITADLVRSNYGIAHFVLHGRLDGWFPRFMLGHQEFLFNGPGVTWAVAIIRALTFGTLSDTGAVKVLAIVAIAAEPLAVAYLARSFRLDRVAAAIAGVLALTATVGFGLGLEGLFVNGLLSHQVGSIPFFVAFGAALRAYDDPSRRRSIVLGIALALLAITHLISVMVLAVMLPVAIVFRLSASERAARVRGLRGLLVSGVVALGLAGFWFVPFAVHRDLHGPVVTWGTDPFEVRIASILRGQLLFAPLVVRLVVLAWVIVLIRAALGHREHLVLITVPTLYLLIAHASLEYPGKGDVTLQLANRGLAYAGVIALLPVAALVAIGARRLGEWTGEPMLTAGVSAIAIVVAVGVAVAHSKEGLAAEITPATSDFRAAAAELRVLVPAGGRFNLTRDYPAEISRVGVIEPARWLAWASGVDTLNAFNPESSNAGAVAYTADGPDPGESIDDWVRALRRLGVTDIVVDRPDIDDEMEGSTLAHLVWAQGPVSIYGIRTETGGTPPVLLDADRGTPTVTFTSHGAERLRWDVVARQSFTATLAVAASPKWHATLDGHSVRIVRTFDGLMQVGVPAGRHTVEIAYRPDLADHLGTLVTVVTLALLLGIPVQEYRRRHTRPEPRLERTRSPRLGP